MSVKSVLESLIRPDTVDEARAFTDAQLKAALVSAGAELRRRGWRISAIGAARGFDPLITKEQIL